MSAQAKPISEVVKEFEQSPRKPSALHQTSLRGGRQNSYQIRSLGTLAVPFDWRTIGLARKIPTEKRVRISPFLDFLGGGDPKELVSDEDSAALQNWVIQRLAKETRSVKNPSIATRRDTALIAALCAAPARGTPRKWPENSLTIEGREVLLWDVAIEEPCFALPLRFWHAWRERLARPDQRRLYRKSLHMEPITTPFPRAQRRSLEPGSPAQRSAATQLGGTVQQHRADHSGKDQSRFPLEGSSLSVGDPALAQTPRAFRAARFRV